MAESFRYRFGKSLGLVLVIAYLLAAILGVGGSALGLDHLVNFGAWYFWVGVILIGLLILRFIPRPFDVALLAPLAVYGGVHQLSLTWTMAGIIVGLPLLLVILMSLGKKE